MAMYNNTGANTVKFDFNGNALANSLYPTKDELSMSIWGMPELDDIKKPDMSLEEDFDMEASGANQYVSTIQNLSSLWEEAKANGIDPSNPGTNRNAQQFSKEWQSAFYENINLGKKLSQSLKNREFYQKASTLPNTIALPLQKGQIVTSDDVNNSILRYDDTPLKQIASAYKNNELVYGNSNLDILEQEYNQAQKAIVGWLDTQPQQFREQLNQQVVLPYLNAIKSPIIDDYKREKYLLDLKKANNSYELGLKRNEIAERNANTNEGKLKLAKEKGLSYDGFEQLMNDLSPSSPNNKTAKEKLKSLKYPINTTNSSGNITGSEYVVPSDVKQNADGSIDIFVNNKKTYTVQPNEIGKEGILNSAYSNAIDNKETKPYKPTTSPKQTNKTTTKAKQDPLKSFFDNH